MDFPLISSPQNERVKAAAKLRDRKGRERQGRILIDGLREISLACAAEVEIVEIFVLADADDQVRLASVKWQRQGFDVIAVAPSVMEKLAYGQRQEVAVAVARTPVRTLADLSADCSTASTNQPPLVLVLEGIEKPGNLGAVVRTADATGASAVIVVDGGTDLYNPNAIRASRGAMFTVPVVSAPVSECLAWLRAQSLRMVAARVDGKDNYAATNLCEPLALILGSEADGLTAQWNAADITPVALPLLGVVDSLNVSVTAAVLCYEALRQRALAGLPKSGAS